MTDDDYRFLATRLLTTAPTTDAAASHSGRGFPEVAAPRISAVVQEHVGGLGRRGARSSISAKVRREIDVTLPACRQDI